MSKDALEPSLTPRIYRFSDVDQFRSSIRGLNVDFTPLARKISAEQIILNLGGCDISVTRSFPRIIDAQLASNCTAVGFMMDDGPPIRFNGVEPGKAVVVIGADGAAYTAVERVERRYAGIMFTPSIRDRGWPQPTASFSMFDISLRGQQRLRELVIQILSVAPQMDASISFSDAASAIRESLLACVDQVFADVVPTKWASYANSTRQFRIFQDIRAILAGSLDKPVYSGQLAHQVGISVRSMHDAILRYRGMSLHRYLRLRRLWLVRKQLLAGATSVKATALAFGFWHLGDFSGSYRLQFGETPSQTLARSRGA